MAMLIGSFRSLPPVPLDAIGGEWPQTSGIGSTVAVILALAFVIVLIILVIRFLANRNALWSRTGGIRHLGGIGIGQHKSVQLVQIGGKLYVLGVGNDIRLLDKIDQPSDIRDILQEMNPPSAFAGRNWLSLLRPGRRDEHPASFGEEYRTDGEQVSFQQMLHSRISDLGNRSGRLKDRLAEDEEAGGKHE